MLLALASKKENYTHLQVRCVALQDKCGSTTSTCAKSSEDGAGCCAVGKEAADAGETEVYVVPCFSYPFCAYSIFKGC